MRCKGQKGTDTGRASVLASQLASVNHSGSRVRSPYRSRAARRGMTLLEILVAFTILAAGLGAFTQVYFANVQQTQSLARHQRALRVLENEIARTRALPPSSLLPGERLPLLTEAEELAPLPDAAGFKHIAPYAAAPDLYELTVALTWTGPNGRRISKSLTTLLPGGEEQP